MANLGYPIAPGKQDGLVLWVPFYEGSGSTAHDLSGNGNDGTIYGAQWTSGRFGHGLDFDGTDDYVDCGAGASLDITGPVTVAVWVHPRAAGVAMIFLEGGGQYVLWVQSDDEVRFADTQGNYVDTAPNVLALNAWNHVVGVFAGVAGDAVTLDNARIYVNGVNRADHVYGTWSPETQGNLNIGRSPNDVNYTNGIIDEARVYNRALSAGEVRRLYHAGLARLRRRYGTHGLGRF